MAIFNSKLLVYQAGYIFSPSMCQEDLNQASVVFPLMGSQHMDHFSSAGPSPMGCRDTNLDFVGHGFVFHEPRGTHGNGCPRRSNPISSGRSHNNLFYLKGPIMFFQTAILRYPKVFSKPIYHNVHLVNPSVCFFNSNVCYPLVI